MSEVACLNGKHCVDTFLDLENFYDSVDNVKTHSASVPAQMESRRFENVPFGAHGTARAENWRPLGRLDFTVQFHPPIVWLFEFLGQSAAVQAATRLTLPFPCSNRPTSRRHQSSQPGYFPSKALHWSVEATCMLDRGLTSLGPTLSQNKSVVVASHPQLLRAVRRELLEQGLSFKGAPSVRDVGLDANAGHRRSVKIQNKREQKCRRRNAHIKVIQNGLKSKLQTMKLFKTRILPAWACAQFLSSAKGLWLQTRVVKGSRLRAPQRFYTSTLERTGTQVSGFRWTSFGLDLSSKAKKWDTDRKRSTSQVRGPLRLLV